MEKILNNSFVRFLQDPWFPSICDDNSMVVAAVMTVITALAIGFLVIVKKVEFF